MATEKLVQTSFVNGQYDREVQSKERADFVGQGLSRALNVLSGEKGEIRKRLGTKHLLDLASPTVLIPFRRSNEDDVIIAINSDGSDNVKGYKYVNGELQPLLTVTSDTAVAFPDPLTWDAGAAGATSVTNGDWTVKASFFSHPDPAIQGSGSLLCHDPYGFGCGNALTGAGGANAPQYIDIDNSNVDVCLQSIKIWFWTLNTSWVDRYGYGYRYFSDPVIQYSDDGVTWLGVNTSYDVDHYTEVEYKSAGIAGERWVTKCLMTISQSTYAQNHRYWRIYFRSGNDIFSLRIADVTFVNVTSSTAFVQTATYTENQLKKLKYAQDSNEMFIACEGVIPYRLKDVTGTLTFGSFTPTNTPTLWSVIGGYPTSVALFQNRLWFGGFENNPQTVIASKFGDYETFDTQNPVQFDDYLNLRCNQLKTKITNIIGGQKVLYAFSEDGLSLVDSGVGGMIATNQSIEFNLRNRMPSGSAIPAFKDDVMLYGSSDGTKLYAVDYDLITERFQVDDLAKYAKDITFDKITELHYVNDESKMIYGLLESGNMFALNYKKGVYQGFFPLKIQDGYVYDIVQIKVGRNYKLLLVTNRGNKWYIEEMPDKGVYIDTIAPMMTQEEKKWATYDNINNNIALDCYQTYDMGIDAISNIAPATGNVVAGVATQQGALTNTGEFTTEGLCDYKKVSDDSVVQQLKVDAYLTTDFIPVKAGGVYTMDDTVNNEYYNTTIRVCAYDGNYNYIEDVLHDIRVLKTEAIAGHRATFTLTMPDNAEYVRIQYFNLDTPILVGEIPDAIALTFDTDVALEVGKTAMLGNVGSKEWVIVNIESKTDNQNYTASVVSNRGNPKSFTKVYPEFSKLPVKGSLLGLLGVVSQGQYLGEYNVTSDSEQLAFYGWVDGNGNYVFTKNNTPSVGDQLYDENGKRIITYYENTVASYDSDNDYITVNDTSVTTVQFNRDTDSDYVYGNIIELPKPVFRAVYGALYDAYAFIKIERPYESMKTVKQINLEVQNTMHLSIGTSLTDMQVLEDINDNTHYDLTNMTMNGGYVVVPADTPEWSKFIIMNSDKGLPFTVNAVEVMINYSNEGGN